jgi:uncharacterized coiled-coil DUF342 family protein
MLAQTAMSQSRTSNRMNQVEQLRQLKKTVTRKIDTLQLQLAEQANSLDDVYKKMDDLKKETNNQDKPDMSSRGQASKLSHELLTMTSLVSRLQKEFDQHVNALDKAFSLQKDLEDKINSLVQENNL